MCDVFVGIRFLCYLFPNCTLRIMNVLSRYMNYFAVIDSGNDLPFEDVFCSVDSFSQPPQLYNTLDSILKSIDNPKKGSHSKHYSQKVFTPYKKQFDNTCPLILREKKPKITLCTVPELDVVEVGYSSTANQ